MGYRQSKAVQLTVVQAERCPGEGRRPPSRLYEAPPLDGSLVEQYIQKAATGNLPQQTDKLNWSSELRTDLILPAPSPALPVSPKELIAGSS